MWLYKNLSYLQCRWNKPKTDSVKIVVNTVVFTSDDSEPSWLEPELELKDFQLGLVGSWPFQPQLGIKNQPKRAEIKILIYVAKS